jgi:nicotinamidase-related amidase
MVNIVVPKVILIVDMIRGFLEKGNNLYCGDASRDIIQNVIKLLDSEIGNGSDLIFLCDRHESGDLEFEMFPVHCLVDSLESELIPELVKYQGLRIYKKRYSGFYGTELSDYLGKINPDQVIVCGVCTDICVMHTVADARNRDYNVLVPMDAVASFDVEAHNWAIAHMGKILGAKMSWVNDILA